MPEWVSPARSRRLTRWAVWALPSRVLTSLLVVELTAIGLLSIDFSHAPITHSALIGALLLAGLGVAHTEIAVGLERLRRRSTDTPHVDLSSVWTFAGAMWLLPLFASLVVLVIFTHQWFRVWRSVGVPAYRHAFSTATVVLACHGAAAVFGYAGQGLGGSTGPGQLLTTAMAVLAYGTVNTGLVAAAIAVSAEKAAGSPRPSTVQLLGHWDDNMLEFGTLSLGALAAAALHSNPWQVLLVVPPLLVLHRAVLVRQLEQAANTDSKTGLLNAAAWNREASRELRRAGRGDTTASVLILDLDHFKAVNDDHGHLAGDEVLGAVATSLRGEVREHDLVGRFGGEEFVVLLPELGAVGDSTTELYAIAERIRHRISTLSIAVNTRDGVLTIAGLSASVGGARFPEHGLSVDQVLEAADSALYAAKRDGRNAVRIAQVPDVPRPRPSGRR